MKNEQMPQFNPLSEDGMWGQLTSGFQIAPIEAVVPVAIQVFYKDGSRVVHTGIIMSTQDVYNTHKGDDDPTITLIYLKGSPEPVRIEWMRVGYVLAEVAVQEWEEGNSNGK